MRELCKFCLEKCRIQSWNSRLNNETRVEHASGVIKRDETQIRTRDSEIKCQSVKWKSDGWWRSRETRRSTDGIKSKSRFPPLSAETFAEKFCRQAKARTRKTPLKFENDCFGRSCSETVLVVSSITRSCALRVQLPCSYFSFPSFTWKAIWDCRASCFVTNYDFYAWYLPNMVSPISKVTNISFLNWQVQKLSFEINRNIYSMGVLDKN